MANTDYRSVDDYIAALPIVVQPILQRVRDTIRKAVPDADEGISYQIPVVKLHGTMVLFFAGWKQHYSIYPVTPGLLEAFGDELAPYKLSKGTIQFPLAQPVPVRLITKLAKFRAKEAAAQATAKRSAAKQR